MRAINISTEVFAKIWAERQDGEENEDAILRRLLLRSELEDGSADSGPPEPSLDSGHTERRFGTHFPGGFEISRIYLGKRYAARAVSQGWLLENDGKVYGSLNELSHSIGAKIENAWRNWLYTNGAGLQMPVTALRDPTKVRRRSRPAVDPATALDELDKL